MWTESLDLRCVSSFMVIHILYIYPFFLFSLDMFTYIRGVMFCRYPTQTRSVLILDEKLYKVVNSMKLHMHGTNPSISFFSLVLHQECTQSSPITCYPYKMPLKRNPMGIIVLSYMPAIRPPVPSPTKLPISEMPTSCRARLFHANTTTTATLQKHLSRR